MSAEITRVYQDKTYIFEWGTKHCTLAQFVDGSKAARCPQEDVCYWIYFDANDTELTTPIKIMEMSENEQDELDFQDILADLADANNRGMYPEVTPPVRDVLVGRSARRDVVFALNTLDENLIKKYTGIVYMASRQVLKLLEEGVEQRIAVGRAVGDWIQKYEGGTV